MQVESQTLSSHIERQQVALSDPEEVQYWAQRFGVSERQLRTAIDQVGDAAPTVERWLRIQMAAV